MNANQKVKSLPRVAVLGTGAMGAAMARRLLEQRFGVHVWNRTPGPAAELAAHGAVAHPDPAGAAAEADVVLTMLPNEAAVSEVMLNTGTLDAFRQGAVWAQMGTIGVAATERLAQQVARRRPDLLFVDAPVSGSRGPARTGGLVILAGGPEPAHERLAPVFAALGQRTQWLGGVGAGSRMKLVLNALLAFEIEAVAEVRALAARLEIPSAQLTDALKGSPLASAFEISKLAKMESGDDSPDFSLEWALKDLDLVLGEAGPAVAPVTASIAERWRALVTQGFGRLDVSAARLGLDSGTTREVGA